MVGLEEKQKCPTRSSAEIRRQRTASSPSISRAIRSAASRRSSIDGFSLYETQAILRYVDAAFPRNRRCSQADPKERARMDQIIGICDWSFFPKAAAPIAFNRIIGPKLLGLPTDEVAIADAMPMARICFAELDRLLGDQPFLIGSNLSIADIMLAAQLDLLATTPEGQELIDGTRLDPWLERMRKRPSLVASQPPEALRKAA